VTVPLRSRRKASPFWIILLLVSGRTDHGPIGVQPNVKVRSGIIKACFHEAGGQQAAQSKNSVCCGEQVDLQRRSCARGVASSALLLLMQYASSDFRAGPIQRFRYRPAENFVNAPPAWANEFGVGGSPVIGLPRAVGGERDRQVGSHRQGPWSEPRLKRCGASASNLDPLRNRCKALIPVLRSTDLRKVIEERANGPARASVALTRSSTDT
jgi:hypothetical protein